ncbi:MAG: hypothetical protein M3282_10460 [Gemmatimonadota bacterium]|nr:hypothetical protein [Gemmatimonadota bacterium]
MSFVCLWSPSWPTGAAFPADLTAALLAEAPRLAVGESGRVWADARGLSGSVLAETLLRVVRGRGADDVRAGVAMTAIAAEVAAVYGEGTPLIIRPGSDRDFLAPFPISVLSPPESLIPLLEGIGVETCNDLAHLQAENIEVRLGADGVRLWRLARADDTRWFFRASPRALPSASLDWVEYTLDDAERLLFVVNALAGSVCAELVARGERAREISLVFSLANHKPLTHTIRTARSSADRTRWMRLIRDALERLTLPDAVTGVALRVERATGNDGAQGDLFDRGFASAGAVEDSLARLVDDQGDDVLVAPQNSQHPLLDARTRWVAEEPVRGARSEARETTQPAQPQLVLQLLTPPRAIAVTTEQRRDHEIPVRYRDDDAWYDLVEAAGPDRVSGGQWDVPYAREYYRCVRGDGLLVWLFRDAARVDTGWYLHGWWD